MACNQDRDEKHQAWIHLPIILLGLGAGTAAPGVAPLLETLLWPALAALLYVTFMQIPLATTAFLIASRCPSRWRGSRSVASRYPRRAEVTGRLAALPVPLLALVLFLVAGSQVETALHSLSLLPRMLGAFLAFLLGAVWYPAG